MTEQGGHVKVAMFGDNSASIHLVKRDFSSMSTWCTREFARRAAWIRDQVHQNKVGLEHYPGTELVADLLTKTLPKQSWLTFSRSWVCCSWPDGRDYYLLRGG